MKILILKRTAVFANAYWVINIGEKMAYDRIKEVYEYTLADGLVSTYYSSTEDIETNYIEISDEDLRKAKLLGSFDFLR